MVQIVGLLMISTQKAMINRTQCDEPKFKFRLEKIQIFNVSMYFK